MTAKEKILVVEEPGTSCSFIAGVDCPDNSGEFSLFEFLLSKERSILYEIDTNPAGNAMNTVIQILASKNLQDMDSGQDNKLLIE